MYMRLLSELSSGLCRATLLIVAIALAYPVTAVGQVTKPALEIGPADAPLTLLVFSDFECPFCARLAPALKRLAENNPKDVRIVFKNFPLAIHGNALAAHEAALVAAGGGRFWEMHDLLFENQSRLGRNDLMEYGRRLQLNPAAVAKAIDTQEFKAVIESDIRDGKNLGVQATPTMFLNGLKMVGVRSLEALQAAVDEHLGRVPTGLTTAAGPPVFDLSGSPARGAPAAPITIVELSDLQCPFCAKASHVIEQILAQYPGKVRWVFKHFPLSFHLDAPLAHRAALAAGEQGRFWEMHDAIFSQQHAMKRSDLVTMAQKLGLNMPRFMTDLDSGRFTAVIDRDMQEGQKAGVTGTPTFYINGIPITGAVPATEFAKVIDAEMARLASATPTK